MTSADMQSGAERPDEAEADSTWCMLIVGAYSPTGALFTSVEPMTKRRILMSAALGDFVRLRFVDLGPPPRRSEDHVAAVARILREITHRGPETGRSYFALAIADQSATTVGQVLADCAANSMIARLPWRARGFASVDDRRSRRPEPSPRTQEGPADIRILSSDPWRLDEPDELVTELQRYADELLKDFPAARQPGLTRRQLDALRSDTDQAQFPAVRPPRDVSALKPGIIEPAHEDVQGTRTASEPLPRPVQAQTPVTAASGRGERDHDSPAADAGSRAGDEAAADRGGRSGASVPDAASVLVDPAPDRTARRGPTRPGRRRLVLKSSSRIVIWSFKGLAWVAVRLAKSVALAVRFAMSVLWQRRRSRREAVWPPKDADVAATRCALAFLVLAGDSSGDEATWQHGRSVLLDIDKKLAAVRGVTYGVWAQSDIEHAAKTTLRPAGHLYRRDMRPALSRFELPRGLRVIGAVLAREVAVLQSFSQASPPAIVIFAAKPLTIDTAATRVYDDLARRAVITWVVPERLRSRMPPLLGGRAANVLIDHPAVADEVVNLLRTTTLRYQDPPRAVKQPMGRSPDREGSQ